MKPKQIVIHIKESKNQKIVGFELDGISKDEAIVILNRCLFQLMHDYDDFVKIQPKP